MVKKMIRNAQYAIRIPCCVFLFLLAACAPRVTSTPFIPPTRVNQEPQTNANPPAATATPLILSAPTASAAEPTLTAPAPSPAPPCTDSLKYVADLTIPDETLVLPGQSIEKQWRVENNGTCDWDSRYRMELMEGYSALGAEYDVRLYPARSGTQGTISITFTAPFSPGLFQSAWRASNPDGVPFGDPVYIIIVVGQ